MIEERSFLMTNFRRPFPARHTGERLSMLLHSPPELSEVSLRARSRGDGTSSLHRTFASSERTTGTCGDTAPEVLRTFCCGENSEGTQTIRSEQSVRRPKLPEKKFFLP
eukprot:GEMP01030104.1.p2 GENE.GEMP01030104.1~~GEMP01030104.1.p2  ORF type:complete len:109 (-),score=26.55 GEMP01030104.1:411-737(-)